MITVCKLNIYVRGVYLFSYSAKKLLLIDTQMVRQAYSFLFAPFFL